MTAAPDRRRLGEMPRARSESGQTAAEYMGVLLVVAVVIFAVVSGNPATKISGQISHLVGSLGEFEDFLRRKLTRIPGVGQVTTSFALRPVVYKTALPVQPAAS